MTMANMDFSELLAKHDQDGFQRGTAEAVLQLIMETDAEGIIGAGRLERSGERTTWRNWERPISPPGYWNAKMAWSQVPFSTSAFAPHFQTSPGWKIPRGFVGARRRERWWLGPREFDLEGRCASVPIGFERG